MGAILPEHPHRNPWHAQTPSPSSQSKCRLVGETPALPLGSCWELSTARTKFKLLPLNSSFTYLTEPPLQKPWIDITSETKECDSSCSWNILPGPLQIQEHISPTNIRLMWICSEIDCHRHVYALIWVTFDNTCVHAPQKWAILTHWKEPCFYLVMRYHLPFSYSIVNWVKVSKTK